jgi:hypothetical protein
VNVLELHPTYTSNSLKNLGSFILEVMTYSP